MVRHLDGALRFPAALGERLGLALAKAIEADDDLAPALHATLLRDPAVDAGAEQAVIEQALQAGKKTPKRSFETDDDAASSAEGGRVVAPGVRLLSHPNGDLTLTGPGLTPQIRASFRGWLKTLGV